MPAIVVLDANSLLMPFQFRLNLDLELDRLVGPARVVVLSSVAGEVQNLAEGGNRHAKAALRLLSKYEQIMVEGRGDDAIVAFALKNPGCIVVTNDKVLRLRTTAAGARCIMLFKTKYLAWATDDV
jgi:uncharacterized protein